MAEASPASSMAAGEPWLWSQVLAAAVARGWRLPPAMPSRQPTALPALSPPSRRSYEEASPKAKQRGSAAAARAALAPWRVILRDAADDMLFCLRGLPHHAQLDEQLRLACWGASVAVAFPTAADARAFAAGLSRVEVQECSLAHTPAAAALEADAAAQALAGARCKAPASCPPSPARAEHPLAGGKRKAETAGLQTPMVKVGGWGGWGRLLLLCLLHRRARPSLLWPLTPLPPAPPGPAAPQAGPDHAHLLGRPCCVHVIVTAPQHM